jgi:hypothetical protein
MSFIPSNTDEDFLGLGWEINNWGRELWLKMVAQRIVLHKQITISPKQGMLAVIVRKQRPYEVGLLALFNLVKRPSIVTSQVFRKSDSRFLLETVYCRLQCGHPNLKELRFEYLCRLLVKS